MAALLPILFGAILTIVTAYAIGAALLRQMPPEIRLACGAALLSILVFLVVLAGVAGAPAFFVLGVAVCAVGCRYVLRPAQVRDRPVATLGASGRIAAPLVFGAYGIWCLINTLAPETLSDGLGYHLGLPFEYIRRGGFPSRIQFFDAVPQGMEMLYTMAFAFGAM